MTEPQQKMPMRVSLGAIIKAAAGLAAGEPQPVERRPVAAPKLHPQVLPRNLPRDYVALDSAPMQQGYAYAGSLCQNGFPGYPYLAQLTQKSEYRAPAETMGSEMTRKFIRLVSTDAASGTPERIVEMNKALLDFRVRDLFRELAVHDDFYGRGQLYIKLKGRNGNPANPLIIDPKTIPKGSLQGLKTIEPVWTTPYAYNSSDPTADDFYKPRSWFVLGKEIAASRLLTFISREVPDILKPAYNFSGISMSQLMEPYVFQWYRTRDAVSNLIHNFSIIALKTNMSATLEDEEGGDELVKRVQLFVASRDNRGLMLLDKNEEELEQIAVPLSGLDDLQAQAQEHMAAPSHIPLVKLLGITPAGLNANSDGEIRVFYDFVRARQEAFFSPHLTTVLKILQLHLFGSIDESITFEYAALHEATAKENSEIRKNDADTAQKYVDMGAISPDEVRGKIGADKDSGYDGLEGEAPGPPEAQMLDHEAGLNKQAAEGEHGRQKDLLTHGHKLGEREADNEARRGETAAQRDHRRQKELTPRKSKP